MSRWLLSVNSLLERLDGQVENVVEERAAIQEDSELLEESVFDPSTTSIGVTGGKKDAVLENILAKRGLSFVGDDDDDDDNDHQQQQQQQRQHDQPSPQPETIDTDNQQLQDVDLTSSMEGLENVITEDPVTDTNDSGFDISSPPHDERAQVEDENFPQEGIQPQQEVKVSEVQGGQELSTDEPDDSFYEDLESTTKDAKQPLTPIAFDQEKKLSMQSPKLETGASFGFESNEYKTALAQAREAQKEARTLRRHVVSLNSQLEGAEAEIKAQRNELERAAERIEKDRIRNKEEREKEKTRHAEELKSLKQQHDATLADHKKRFEQQLDDARQHLRQVEERRMQEGGDWNKELAGALDREKEMVRKVAALEDERSTFLSQISTLQAQQEALGNRLESLTQTAESAMERERDAEDRLDAALSLHARQLSQRQSREASLERTISELGAALAVARDREIQRLKLQSESSDVAGDENGPQDAASVLRRRLDSAHHELESVQAQLAVERQRSEALHREMRDVAKERADEASVAHARQLQYDRQIADMSVTISRLQLMLRESKKGTNEEGGENNERADDDTMAKQIRNLSEEVIRLREKVSSYSSEISALKSRLQGALDRAAKAEAALTSSGNGSDLYDIMERAPSSGNGGGMRRRGGGGGSGGNRRSNRDASYASITAAIRLDGSQGKGTERIGKAIDALDSFSVETGKYMRYNPLARGAFILYLLVLHLWTFGLLFFHTHVFEPVHGDFGAGAGLAHGPHALMLQRNIEIPKIPAQPKGSEGLKQLASDTSNPLRNADKEAAVTTGENKDLLAKDSSSAQTP